MTDAELVEVMSGVAERQLSAMLNLFEVVVVALDRRGVISRAEVVQVLREGAPHLDSIGTLSVFNRAIRDLTK